MPVSRKRKPRPRLFKGIPHYATKGMPRAWSMKRQVLWAKGCMRALQGRRPIPYPEGGQQSLDESEDAILRPATFHDVLGWRRKALVTLWKSHMSGFRHGESLLHGHGLK